jgi:hypothetical protein
MTDGTVVPFDLGRRARRSAMAADRAALAAALATLAQIDDADLVRRAHEVAAVVMADGLPTSSMGEPGGGAGGHGDPTLSAVLQRQQHGRELAELRTACARINADAVRVFRLMSSLVALTVTPAEEHPPGAGHCQRCGRWVAGSASDRIKSGWCPACYVGWRRAGGPDRGAWNRGGSDDPDGPAA